MSEDVVPEPVCLNCGAVLAGPWCHACGQKVPSAHLGLHDVVHDATHEFLHLDGKIVRTVKLLVTRPGELTREFLAGRRARYISPLRLYLTFSLLFFTLAAILPDPGRPVFKVSRDKTQLHGDTAFKRQLNRGLLEVEKDGRRVGERVLQNVPKMMFVLMPIFALITWSFYWRQQRFYVPHLYHSIHFHAFVFLLLALYVLLSRLGLPRPVTAPLLLLTIPYHFIGLRRVFGGSRFATVAKGLTIGLIYWLVSLATLLAITFAVVYQAGAAV